MDSDEEFLSFSSETEKPSSPLPERKFKRLKKVTDTANVSIDPLLNLSNDSPPSPPTQLADSPNFTLDSEEQTGEIGGDFEEPILRSGSGDLEKFVEGSDLDSGFAGLKNERNGAGVKRALEFDSMDEEFNVEGGDRMEEEIGDFRAEGELEKKLPDSEGFKDKKKGKKKKRVKSGGDGYIDEPFPVGTNKKREGKERRERFTELRVEYQRVLRETRETSFKPPPLVQKSVSSVLEKIRLRKCEVSEKLVCAQTSSFNDYDDCSSREIVLDCDSENDVIEDIEVRNVARADSETNLDPVDAGSNLDSSSGEGSKDGADHSPKTTASEVDLNKQSKQRFRAPVDDTQDLSFDSQTSDSKDNMPDDLSISPMEEVLAPSLLAMNLKLDSAPPDDLSDEEDNDKENIDPCQHKLVDLSLSPKGDPMKAFVDEEAEEEDDSDHDLMRFKDSEEDEDELDSEELNDIIATGYEENPIDNEKRNQLHQKWLEQQDADGTENLLRKLKCGSKQMETTFLEEKEGEEDEEEFLDEAAEVTRNVVKMNLKKAKEMISQMFTDKDDVYVSSDDEETQTRLVKEQLSYKAGEQATFLSPADAEGSKEIFGLIKKSNGVPDTRKRAKITSYFHMQSVGGNRTMSSKSSFLGRGSKNSLPSARKHGSSTVRSFVFERDDSNSRSTLSVSEDSSDMTQLENRPRKTVAAKFNGSQIRSSTQNTQTAGEIKSGPSLHEILRSHSLQPSHRDSDSSVSQVEAIYAAFKIDQNKMKQETKVSIRTV